MSFGITKTIPQTVATDTIKILYGEFQGEYQFHMAGSPSKLKVGDYVYTILDNQLIGRLKITRMEAGAQNPASGKSRTLIYVQTPGERLAEPFPRQGHRGTRYYDGADWPGAQLRR